MSGTKIVVIVDTTVTFPDVTMSRTRWMQLLSLCAKEDIRLIVPDVVLRETARHWEVEAIEAVETVTKQVDRLLSSRDRLRFLGLSADIDAPSLVPKIEINRIEFLKNATARLSGLRVALSPLPKVGIDELVERDIENRKPFTKSGKGFRDALIWESVKEIQRELDASSIIYFVSDNIDDYCLGEALHPDLTEEVADMASSLRHVRNLDELLAEDDFRSMVSGLVADDGELERFLAATLAWNDIDVEFHEPTVADIVAAAILDATENLINEEVDNGNVVSSGLNFKDIAIPVEIESPTIVQIDHEVGSIDWQTYETYDETTLLIRATVVVDLSLDGFAYKSDIASFDTDVIHIVDWEWNDHMAQISASVRARLVFQMRVEIGVGVEDVEFDSAEIV